MSAPSIGVLTLKSPNTPLQSFFLDLLFAARRKAQLTQQQLAKQLGRPQSFVAKYEGGERRLDVIEFLHLAEFLEMDPAHTMRQLMKFRAAQGNAVRGKLGDGTRRKPAGGGGNTRPRRQTSKPQRRT